MFGTIEDGVDYRPRPGGYAVIVRNRQVAVVRTPRGYFLPGGGLEGEESLAAAAVRETKEETGLIISITCQIGTADEYVHSPNYGAYFQKICTFFSAGVVSQNAKREPDHDLVWASFDEAVNLLTHGSQRWAVTQFSTTLSKLL